MSDEGGTLGAVAYAAYCSARLAAERRRAERMRLQVRWDELSADERAAWDAAGVAARDAG